ncbi:MAG: SusE domain-containing protein [Lewinella sp.]|nr:SusE domain-containing protein [Lewinella sp.]
MLNKKIFLGLMALALLWSCEEAVFDPVLESGVVPIILSPADGSTYVLTEENADNVMAKFAWTAADFGYNAAVTYELQADRVSGDFSTPIGLGQAAGGELSLSVTNQRMNDAMLANGFPFDVATDLLVRVKASIKDQTGAVVSSMISETITITVTAFEQVINYPKLWVPGDYWDPQWSPENSPNVWSFKSDDKYEGYINFPNATNNFKYTPAPNWDADWGDNGQDGTLDPSPGADNIVIDGAGYYKMNVDLNALTHTYTKTDWGLIGDATPGGWDTDTNMTYDPATRSWSVTLDLVEGKIKFRANDAWDIDFGDNEGDFVPDYGGSDIPVTAGNYTIELLLERAPYQYKITQN